MESRDGKVLKSGCLDAGYPLPGKIRQAQFVLPNVVDWEGLKLRAEIEVKGMRHPVRWACHQKLNDDQVGEKQEPGQGAPVGDEVAKERQADVAEANKVERAQEERPKEAEEQGQAAKRSREQARLEGQGRKATESARLEEERRRAGEEVSSRGALDMPQIVGRELRTLRGQKAYISGLAVSGDGRLALSASADNTVKVWDMETGLELHNLEGHTDSILEVVVSRDGRLALSASADNTVKVWDMETGRELRTLRGRYSVAVSEEISPKVGYSPGI